MAAAATVVALAVVVPFVVAPALSGPAPRPPHPPAPLTYAALGDSYASGALIPTQLADPAGCVRSNRNYPHLVAAALHLVLTDVSCGGATTADMTGVQQVSSGPQPPQLDAVHRSTSVVSLTVGGDDLGFSDIIENCLALTPLGPTRVGLTCRDHYDAGGVDQLAAAVARAGGQLGEVLGRVHALAPRARVFLVGYPAIFPPTGSGCWPQMPFTRTDVTYLRDTELDLDHTLATVARAHRTTYVDTYTATESHNACQPEAVRWIEPVLPDAKAAPVHPNAAGQQAMARLLTAALRADRLR